MATDLSEILTDLTAHATTSSRIDTTVAADARIALSRLRPALDRLHDDGLNTGISTVADPDGFTRQAERVHWVRLLANTCARLGDATPASDTPGPMTRLADAAAITAVLHAGVLTGGQRWAIVAGLARTANHLVTAAGGGGQSTPDVDRALIIAEASSGVLFQFAALDPPSAADYDAMHRPVPDPAARPTSRTDAALEASAALVHTTRPGTGPHTVADILAIATAARTACVHVATRTGIAEIAAVAGDAAAAWKAVREELAPFNDGSRRPQLFRPPAVEHALALHRALQPTTSTPPSARTEQTQLGGVATVVDRLVTVAVQVDAAVADGVRCGRFMANAADLAVREPRVAAFLEGHRAAGLVTADTDDLAPVRSAVLHARTATTNLAANLSGVPETGHASHVLWGTRHEHGATRGDSQGVRPGPLSTPSRTR